MLGWRLETGKPYNRLAFPWLPCRGCQVIGIEEAGKK